MTTESTSTASASPALEHNAGLVRADIRKAVEQQATSLASPSDCVTCGGSKLVEAAFSSSSFGTAPCRDCSTAHPAPAATEGATWTRVTRAGQVKNGDQLRFTIGDKSFSERAKLILHPGSDKEEVIYNKRNNFYYITSMVISGASNHKGVEFLRTKRASTKRTPEAPHVTCQQVGATNGMSGRPYFDSGEFRAVLSDYNIGNMTEFQLVEHIKDHAGCAGTIHMPEVMTEDAKSAIERTMDWAEPASIYAALREALINDKPL